MLAGTQEEIRTWKRRLLVRDSLVFLGLIAVTAALFLVTLLLFRSFSTHRVELAQRWYSRGQRDLGAGNPKQAVVDLRTALGYAPEERKYQMLLAQALSEAGDPNEALAYFLNLWESQPGSGPLNLQLARLTAKSGSRTDALRYYRAAIYGTWEGDGTARRREVRLELIRYLLSKKEYATAQTELLIAAGNATDEPPVKLEIAELMVEAGEVQPALMEYEKVLARVPHNAAALTGAGETAFQMQHYASAQRFLENAARHLPPGELDAAAKQMLTTAHQMLALYPAQNLSNAERAARVMKLRDLALARWTACQQKLSAGNGVYPAMGELTQQWKTQSVLTARNLRDPEVQEQIMTLVFATEQQAAQACGVPQGDDALLLMMARSPATVDQ